MAISITCPGCQSVYPVADNLVGKTIRCKKCGEMMAVTAPPATPARPVVAAPVAARPAARVVEDDEDARPARPAARRVRDEDEEDAPRAAAAPAKKGSGLLLALGAMLGVLVLGGAGIGALFATGVLGGKTESTGVADSGPRAAVANPVVMPPNGGETQVQRPAPNAGGQTNIGVPVPAGPTGGREKPPLVATPITPTPTRPAAGGSPSGPSKENIDQITLDKCKHAAVFIKIEDTKGGGATGSGWFGLEPNLIFTNSHVLGMKAPGSPKPAKVTVWVNPGTPQEKEIPHSRLEILAVDREMDLAVMRVLNEKDLPAPLQTRPSSELHDLERTIVLGYPGGYRLSERNRSNKPPAVTIGDARVQTLRRDDDGNLYSVQLQSNVVHGNSGGPIVDTDGNVVGVAVRVDLDRQGRFTGIAYGVPTEYVTGILAGRVAEVEYGQAYRSGGGVHIPVTAHCLDPLQRLKTVGIAYWVGEADGKKSRPPGASRTAEPGDVGYAEATLNYQYRKDDPVATGEIVLPELPAGRAYWTQPFYSNALVSKYFLAGNPIKLSGPPVDREPADLIVRYKTGARRQLTLSNSSSLEEFEEGEGADKSERVLIESELKMTEQVQRPSDSAAVASLLLNYEKLAIKAQIGQKTLEDILPKEFRTLFSEGIKRVQGLAHVNKGGEIYKTLSNLRNVGQFAPLFKAFSDDALESLKAASIPLPNTRVEAGHNWKDTKSYRLQMTVADPSALFEQPAPGGRPGTSRPAPKPKSREYRYQQNVTYTYLGSRVRAGVKEGVIKIEGTLSAAPGAKASEGASGTIKGYAYVDLDTGTILEAEVEKELEIDTSGDGLKKRVSGINKYKLSRGSSITS